MDFDDIPAAAEEEQQFVIDDVEQSELPPPPVPEASVDVFEQTDAPYEYIGEPEPAAPVEDALTKFNREWNARIEVKRGEEFEFEKQARAKAQEELAAWKQQKEIRLQAKKDKNRSEQSLLVETVASESQNLKVWDRVGKLVDATESETKGSNNERMRRLFIQLKNEPLEVTRAAAGVC